MESIIISGMPAAGKSTVAEILAKRLKLKAINVGDIIKSKFLGRENEANYWDTYEGFMAVKKREEDENIDKSVDKAVLRILKKGNIIITSYVMPWLSKHGYKVWLEASPEERAKRLAKRDKLSLEEGINIIRRRDKENYLLYKKLYNINLGKDKKPFDLVIDTEKLSPEEIADIIIKNIKDKIRIKNKK